MTQNLDKTSSFICVYLSLYSIEHIFVCIKVRAPVDFLKMGRVEKKVKQENRKQKFFLANLMVLNCISKKPN